MSRVVRARSATAAARVRLGRLFKRVEGREHGHDDGFETES